MSDNRQPSRMVYKTVGSREIELLFFPPAAPGSVPAPLLILIPGGGWNASNARSMADMEQLACETLRNSGFAVAALSYRNHREDGVNMREMVTDIFDGADYLARHAGALGIDPRRFYTSGHSAGAHLALLLAYAPVGFPAKRADGAAFTVRATAPLSPPVWLQPGEPAPYRAFPIDELFVGCEEDYRLFSPLALAQEGYGVSTFTAVGTADNLVFPRNGEELTAALRAHGVRAEWMAAQNGGHAFEPTSPEPVSPDFTEIQRRMAAFFLEEDAMAARLQN